MIQETVVPPQGCNSYLMERISEALRFGFSKIVKDLII
jgi:hypothetical protein